MAREGPFRRLTVSRAGPSIPRIDVCSGAILTVEPLGLLAVDRDALPAKQDVQPSIAEPPALLRQFA